MDHLAGELGMYTIYDHPTDFPDHFVVRLWRVGPEGAVPTSDLTLHHSLDAARAAVPYGLYCLDRMAEDDPKIVEVWL